MFGIIMMVIENELSSAGVYNKVYLIHERIIIAQDNIKKGNFFL